MKKVLFIGSIVLDMIVTLDHLPKLKEDINTDGIKFSVGGCCHNASQIVKHFGIPTIVCSPIGTGHFASLLKSMLDEKPFVQVKDQDNGVCMCLVDKNGERTFLSEHGVEYQFNEEWLKDIKFEDLDYIYICGLEIEDVSGNKIIEYIEKSNVKVFFAPGSRFMHIPELEKMGANIKVLDKTNIEVTGPSKLIGNEVTATDLRAGAAMILAALVAEGTTTIHNIKHILRGYEDIVEKLTSVGAKIELKEI